MDDKLTPRVSVIMGIYNCEETLKEALESLMSQSYQNFKVIMCDDGSLDNTYLIAKEFADIYHDKFILIKNERNIKLAATLNHCLQYADTEYVARMDGDDLCDPLRFEKQVKFLDEHLEFSHVSTPMKFFDETGFYGLPGKLVPVPSKNEFKSGVPYCHAPTMFRKSTLDKVGGYTADPRVERIEDYYLWYKIHKAGMQGYNLEEPLYFMRNDKNAFSRRKFKDRWRGFKVKLEVCKGMEIRFGMFYALKDLSKAFVPMSLVRAFKRYI